MMTYLPGTILSSWIRSHYGLRASILAGNILNVGGCILRALSALVPASHGGRYALALAGQTVAGMGQPFFTNMPASIAGTWFPAAERELATSVGALVNPLGNAAGSVVPGFTVHSGEDLAVTMLVTAAVASLVLVATYLGVSDKPPTPPSAAASSRLLLQDAAATGSPLTESPSTSAPEKEGLLASVHTDGSGTPWQMTLALLRDRNFLFLLFGFGTGYSMFNAFLTLIAQMVAPCGYGAGVAGLCGAIVIGAGLVGATVAGIVLEKTKAYVLLLKSGIVLCTAGVVFMLSSLAPDQEGLLIASFAVMGFSMLPMLPIALENAAEYSFPMPEETAAALLLIVGQYGGVIFTFAIQNTIPDTCNTVFAPSSILIAASLTASGLVLVWFKANNRRQRAEKESHDMHLQSLTA